MEFHIQNKTDGILVLGTTGETSTMTHEEDDIAVKTVLDAAGGRIFVMVGTGSNNTAVQKQKSLDYEAMGADGLLIISPYYNKANPQGLYHHFMETAEAVNIPVVIYNIPGRTGVSIPADVVGRLSKHPNVAGIKEASGSISYAMDVAPYLNEDFKMYSGNDDIIVPMLALGASGVISVLANIAPKETHDMVEKFQKGDVKGSMDLQLKYLDLIHSLFCEVNPIPVKTAMNDMGFNMGGLRLPLYKMDEKNHERLRESLLKAGLL